MSNGATTKSASQSNIGASNSQPMRVARRACGFSASAAGRACISDGGGRAGEIAANAGGGRSADSVRVLQISDELVDGRAAVADVAEGVELPVYHRIAGRIGELFGSEELARGAVGIGVGEFV